MNKLFFDTYALIEILRGNPAYASFQEATPIINQFVFAELCTKLVKEVGEQAAFVYADQYIPSVVLTENSAIKEAAVLRCKWHKMRVSFTDCLGYVQAKRMGIKFLTGDKEFKEMDNVEFVK